MRTFAARTGALYLVLYLFPAPLGGLPIVSALSSAWQRLEARVIARAFTPVVGHPIAPSEMSDALWRWLSLPCLLTVAALASSAWVWRRPSPSPRLREAFVLYLRVALATTMIGFGVSKILRVQFEDMPVFRLFVSVGEQSPMGLLWSFMGFSRGYCTFVGLAELLGGALLLWSSTVATGALVLVAVMTNVVAMNLAYDVPVKLDSSHDLVIALVLLTPHVPRLLAALRGPVSRVRWAPVALIVLASLPIVKEKREMLAFDRAPCPLEGMWTVETFTQDGVVHPATLDDRTRWRRLAFFGTRFVANDIDDHMMLTAGAEYAGTTLKVTPDRDQAHPYPMTFVREGDALTLDGHGVHLTARYFDPSKTRLYARGFHSVSEGVYNY